MRLLRARGRSRRSIAVATVLYALVLAASAFEHHDLLCHLRNPQHCTACTASPLGSDPQALAAPRPAHLADAGRATALSVLDGDTMLVVRTTGRSPPAAA